MGISKTQLVNSVKKVKGYVDAEVAKIDTTGETTYTDEEVDTAVDAALTSV